MLNKALTCLASFPDLVLSREIDLQVDMLRWGQMWHRSIAQSVGTLCSEEPPDAICSDSIGVRRIACTLSHLEGVPHEIHPGGVARKHAVTAEQEDHPDNVT